jgi:hypothetical protein
MPTRALKPKLPTRFAIYGYGVLGHATTECLINQYDTDEAIGIIIDVLDPKYSFLPDGSPVEKLPKRKILSAGLRIYQRILPLKHISIEDYDVVIVCVPSDRLNVFLANFSWPGNPLVVIRTTADFSLGSNRLKQFVYFPEDATEKDIARGRLDNQFWFSNGPSDLTNSMSSMFGFGLHRTDDLNALVAQKLLRNAYLASIYAFKNEAAKLYHSKGISKPLSLDISRVSESLIDSPFQGNAMAFGGKCLPSNLRMLSDSCEDSPGSYNHWKNIYRSNEDSLISYAQLMMLDVDSRSKASTSKSSETPVPRVLVYGLQNNSDVPNSPVSDGIGEWFLKVTTSMSSPAIQNPKPHLKYISEKDVVGNTSSEVQASKFAVLLQPFSKRMSALKSHISANIESGIHSLVIYDPLKQLRATDISKLLEHAYENPQYELLIPKHPFSLHVVTTFRKTSTFSPRT